MTGAPGPGFIRTRPRDFFKRHGLRASVVVICLISIAILWTGLLVQLNIDRGRIIGSKRLENGNLAKVFEEHVARTIRAAEVMLQEIDSEYRRYGMKFDLVRYAKDRSIYLDPYNILSIVDENGDLILANSPLSGRISLRKTDSYQYHAQHDTPEIFISLPRRGSTTGRWTVYLTRRINKADGSFGGLSSVGMDPGYFSKIYAELDLGQDSVVSMIGRDGMVRAHSAGADLATGQNVASSEIFTKFLPAANHGSFLGESLADRITRINSYRALKNYPLVVLVGTSQAVALAEHDRLRSMYMQAAGAMTAVILCLGLFALFQIARSKRAEEAIHKLNAELEQRVRERTAKLEAANKELETFSYSVAHDLRAPLRGIDGYSRLLQAAHSDTLGDEGRGFVHNIIRATQHMSQLIEDLLAYSRLERREMQIEPVDPRALVESLLADRADEIRKRGVALSVAVPFSSMTADREGLTMALRNLLENALKFTRDVPQPAIEVSGRDTGATCILAVRDNGVGFDMKFHDRIFGIFQRLHRSEDYLGTGVGLAIVKKAMQRMGGRAWAEGAPGNGATFYLEIPK